MPAPLAYPDAVTFARLWEQAAAICTVPPLPPDAAERRIELWRRQEWHNWFRWRVCKQGFDWSKPAVILLLALGFTTLIVYGYTQNAWHLTAGGIVLWFTVVNLSFFTYFGLTLPGPPLPVPGPLSGESLLRADMGVYPPGYERRKLARIWLRIGGAGGAQRFELAINTLPRELAELIQAQATWRIQRADAPLAHAVLTIKGVTRAQIDQGAFPFEIAAWEWDQNRLDGFDRKRIN